MLAQPAFVGMCIRDLQPSVLHTTPADPKKSAKEMLRTSRDDRATEGRLPLISLSRKCR